MSAFNDCTIYHQTKPSIRCWYMQELNLKIFFFIENFSL